MQRQLLRSTRAASKFLAQASYAQRTQAILPSPLSSLSSRSTQQPSRILPRSLQRRWQSTETTNDEAKTAEPSSSSPSDSSSSQQSPSSEDALRQDIEKQKKEIIDLKVCHSRLSRSQKSGTNARPSKDKYLRSVADYRNLQDRTARDSNNARQFAIQRFATDLLESIDNLDRALSAVPEKSLQKSESNPEPNQDLLNLHNGLKMTERVMMEVLKKHGLERFDPLENGGRKFDPNLDEATFFNKMEDKEDGDVFYTQSKGYLLNGRVIRASKVGVVKNS